jgi:hypothetical protein
MEIAIEAELERWVAGAPPRAPRPDVIERCSCQRLVRELAALYEALATRRAAR